MTKKENNCENHCRKCLYPVGIFGDTSKSVLSFIYVSVMSGNIIYLFYKILFTDSNQVKVLHFITLSYFYTGTLWTLLYKRGDIIYMAKEADKFVGITDKKMKDQYRVIQTELLNSNIKNASDIMCCMVAFIATYITVEQLFKGWLSGKPTELLFGGREENVYKFTFLYISQSAFMTIAGIVCIIIVQVLIRVCLEMTAKFKLLNFTLSSMRGSDNKSKYELEKDLAAIVRQCVIHHQHIFKIFKVFKGVCGYAFYFIYFGLISATTLSRTLLVGDEPDMAIIPVIIVELAYVFFYCFCLDELADESESVRFSIYSSDWLQFPTSTTKDLRLIMLRSIKPPHVRLYRGGGPAILATFAVIINATFAYITSALLFNNNSKHAI